MEDSVDNIITNNASAPYVNMCHRNEHVISPRKVNRRRQIWMVNNNLRSQMLSEK